jgi:5'-phosphate synthase pdxT subunit
MNVGVLALQGDFAEHVAVLTDLGVDAREVRLPEQLAGLDGLLIPGGESTTISRLMADYGLFAPVQTLASGRLPIWGTCAGLILLAREIPDLDRPGLNAMDIAVERNAYGRQVDSFEADLDVPALGPPPFHAVFIRAPVIQRVGPQIEVLARLDGGSPVAVRQGNLLATAFHPELTDDPRFHEYFLKMAEEGRKAGADSVASAGAPH